MVLRNQGGSRVSVSSMPFMRARERCLLGPVCGMWIHIGKKKGKDMNNINIPILMAAIAIVESNTNDNAVGAAGERSRYQITPRVWNAYAVRGERPECPSHASRVGVAFINAEIIPALRRQNIPITAKTVAACWNFGPKAARRDWPERVKRYADNVQRQYNILLEQENFLEPTP